MTAEQDLDRIINDPAATQTERDVARRVKADLQSGWYIAKDHIHVLTGYIQRQQAQNRYGR